MGLGIERDQRADDVGEALKDVDAHGALAGHLEARDLVEPLADRRIDLERGAAREDDLRQLGDARLTDAAMLQRVEDDDEFARRGLEARGHIDVVRAKLDAELPHLAADVLVEAFDVVGHFGARQDAEVLEEAEGDAAGGAVKIGRRFERDDALELRVDEMAQPKRQSVLHAIEQRTGQAFVGENGETRCNQGVAFGERGNDFALPADIAVGREHELFVRSTGEPFRSLCDLRRDGLFCSSPQPLRVDIAVRARKRKAEPLDRSHEVAFEAHLAALVDFRTRH
jgi:hypothetical protein